MITTLRYLQSRRKFLLLGLVAASLILLSACSGLGASPTTTTTTTPAPAPTPTPPAPPPPLGIKAVNHVIFMLQENRSFDNYFGHLAGVDGLPPGTSNKSDSGVLVNAFHLQTACLENTDPDWLGAHGSYNLQSPGSNTYLGDGFVHGGQGSARSDGFIAYVANSMGTFQVSPTKTTNYYLYANSDGYGNFDTRPLAVASVTVSGDTQTPSPVAPNITPASGVVFTATPSTITSGQSTTLTWTVPNARDTMINWHYDLLGTRAMGYYTGDDLNYYYYMASTFATSDRWFSPVSSNSPPNRSYMYAATTHGHAHDPGSFDSGVVKNIFQLLDAAGITWKVYYTTEPGNPNVPHTFLTRFQPFASQHMANLVPTSQYFDDLKNGTLPQVAFIEELPGEDEHPGAVLPGNIHSGNNVQAGAQYVSTFINTFMNSPYWKDGVFILTFDEGGGYYDHVSPQPAVHPDGLSPTDLTPVEQQVIQPPGDFNRTGYRVPLIVVSPFTKKGYVSHSVADFTAILKFIETRFNLPSLTKRDAAQIDMQEFFTFDTPPTPTPPTPPLQSLNMRCDYTALP
ncbi:MAG TPA: alkaline phosphatase family protein [Terriglobales bacterium]|nr:alkaline phosphatase family protein [Terriglobales bacterium]